MNFTAYGSNGIGVDMTQPLLFNTSASPRAGGIETASRNKIEFYLGGSYYGYAGRFVYTKSGGIQALNWKKSVLTGYENNMYHASGFRIRGRDLLKAAKRSKSSDQLKTRLLEGDDVISGWNRTKDVLTGMDGNDRLVGLSGDVLIGGSGADLFGFLPQEGSDPLVIRDFNPAEGDRIVYDDWAQDFGAEIQASVAAVDGGIEVRLIRTSPSGPVLPFVLEGHSAFDSSWVAIGSVDELLLA